MRNIKLTIEYDGTAYHGWQSQINAIAVQDVVSSAIRKLTGEEINLIGASRTDFGVHALGQTANFRTDSSIPADKFAFALNTMLPDDIVIRKSEEADGDFHSRFSAKGKHYTYLFYNSVFPSALLRQRAYHVFYPLDVRAMAAAAQSFLGTHDFAAFSATGSNAKTTTRTITGISVKKGQGNSPEGICSMTGAEAGRSGHPFNPAGGDIIELDIEGDGFLYNMVRIIAGTLVEVGYGRLDPAGVPGIIEGRDRKKAGRTAPAHGLYLVEVYY